MKRAQDKALDTLPRKPNLRPAEVAEFLDCTLETVYKMIHEGVIPAKKLFRHYRIPRDQFVDAYEKNVFDLD